MTDAHPDEERGAESWRGGPGCNECPRSECICAAIEALTEEKERLAKDLKFQTARCQMLESTQATTPQQMREMAAKYFPMPSEELTADNERLRAQVHELRDQRISRDRDIILQAINEYNEWMLDDCFDALGCLQRIMDRMKDRVALSTQPEGQDNG